jgi:hypothetical protein
MAQFPVKGRGPNDLSQGESPSIYKPGTEINDVRADAEGGYEFRRPRTTRGPRETVKTGFIGLPHDDYLKLKAFWDAHLTTEAFTYYDYVHGIYRTVRFEKEPDWGPQIIGTNRMWSPTFELKEL